MRAQLALIMKKKPTITFNNWRNGDTINSYSGPMLVSSQVQNLKFPGINCKISESLNEQQPSQIYSGQVDSKQRRYMAYEQYQHDHSQIGGEHSHRLHRLTTPNFENQKAVRLDLSLNKSVSKGGFNKSNPSLLLPESIDEEMKDRRTANLSKENRDQLSVAQIPSFSRIKEASLKGKNSRSLDDEGQDSISQETIDKEYIKHARFYEKYAGELTDKQVLGLIHILSSNRFYKQS